MLSTSPNIGTEHIIAAPSKPDPALAINGYELPQRRPSDGIVLRIPKLAPVQPSFLQSPPQRPFSAKA